MYMKTPSPTKPNAKFVRTKEYFRFSVYLEKK